MRNGMRKARNGILLGVEGVIGVSLIVFDLDIFLSDDALKHNYRLWQRRPREQVFELFDESDYYQLTFDEMEGAGWWDRDADEALEKMVELGELRVIEDEGVHYYERTEM